MVCVIFCSLVNVFNPDGSGKVENLEPGTVIDEVVVSSSVPEYYLHSHNVVSVSINFIIIHSLSNLFVGFWKDALLPDAGQRSVFIKR